MSAVRQAIALKKRGAGLDPELIERAVSEYMAGAAPDYQMSALLMAIFINGMDHEETLALTRAMADSGERYAFPDCVDKHSTGGIGDKITLTALPLAVAAGAPVAKLSGRGLGHTGGTIDKLEAIPGLTCALDRGRFERQVADIGFAIVEAAGAAPADKAIYALRDATETVDSLALIASSIVSKKVATGAGHLLYDVKRGAGAFMTSDAAAGELATLLVQLSEGLGIAAAALITGMDQPLGSAVGNALELRESVRLLAGEEVAGDLALLARRVATELVALKGIEDPAVAVEQAIASGEGLRALSELVAAQGGDPSVLERGLAIASETWVVAAPRDGHLAGVAALAVGRAALALGAGRETKEDAIDHSVGIEVAVKVGDWVERGQPLAVVYGARSRERVAALLDGAFELSDDAVAPLALIAGDPAAADAAVSRAPA